MIKIILEDETSILDFHYRNLTKKIGREWTVIDRIKRNRKKHSANATLVAMYDYLLNKVEKDAKGFSILTAKPHDLEKIIVEFENLFPG